MLHANHLPLAVILPGVLARYRRRECGRWETPSDYLPNPAHVFMKEVAGMDGELFYARALKFIEETEYLRRNNRKILLVYDGYACHITFRVLNMFHQNRIVVVSLPAYTSHALQPLDVVVFGVLKN